MKVFNEICHFLWHQIENKNITFVPFKVTVVRRVTMNVGDSSPVKTWNLDSREIRHSNVSRLFNLHNFAFCDDSHNSPYVFVLLELADELDFVAVLREQLC